MHLKSFTRADWLKVGGAAALLVSSFLAWLNITLEQGDMVRRGTANAYDFAFTGAIPVVLAVSVGAVTVLLAVARVPRRQQPWPLVLLLAALVAVVLLMVRLIVNPYDGTDNLEQYGGSVVRGVGMVLAVLAALVVFVGALLAFLEERRGHTDELLDSQQLQWGAESSPAPVTAPQAWGMPATSAAAGSAPAGSAPEGSAPAGSAPATPPPQA